MAARSASTFGLAVVVATAVLCLAGCGGGGGGGGGASPRPTPSPTLKDGCTSEQTATHCTDCDPLTRDCIKCGGGYGLENETKTCIAQCLLPGPGGAPWVPPAQPPPGVYHGISWPMDCHNETTVHFFGIGDWGGASPGIPVDNTHGRPWCDPVDNKAQSYVAQMMNDRAKKVASPKFVLSAGDQFYWGGIPRRCGGAAQDPSAACTDGTFQSVFENMYEFKDAPWFACLGNHDFGGMMYSQGWDYQIYRTYCKDSRFRMPGFYWHQKVQFRDFAVDVFIVDTNANDGLNHDANHDICQRNANCQVPNTSFTDNQACASFLEKMFNDGMDWLDESLSKSTAEWTIAVNHYPPTFRNDRWKTISKKHGLDLVFSGHRHEQELHYGAPNDPMGKIMGEDFSTWIVSGGGGGITSEGLPNTNGQDDQYGFVDFTISRDSMTIEMISHGGSQHTEFITRQTKTIKPRPKNNLPHTHVDKSDELVV